MPILETRGLKKTFGGVTAVRKVDLKVDKNEIYSVIGPNGAGKSTLFNLISGFHQCDEGRVFFKGKDITGLAPEKIVRLGMGRSFQVTSIFPRLTVFENVQAATLFREGRGLSLFSDSGRVALKNTEQMLALVELLDKRDEPAGTLPAGDRKKLELGIVLATRPDLLLLDEPTCGMSPIETSGTIDLIRKIAREMSLTVLLTEHKMDMVFSVSSHITVMNFGMVVAAGRPEQIHNNKQVQDIYLGES
jgi:branched-chain amino acid transport system ATP-binding protein